MQFTFNDAPEGINPGAGSRGAGPIGISAENSPASAASAGSGRGGRREPIFPDPRSCDHRHSRRQWDRVRKDYGFDNGSLRRSQWQLVPLGEKREVELWWDRISPKQVFSEDPSRASVHASGNRYVITGLQVGNTAIHAMNAKGICRSELEITVRKAKQIPVVFHYVQEKRHQTSRPVDSGGKLLEGVNKIIAPQTCVSFREETNPAPIFRIAADLGDFVDPHAADVTRLCQERIDKLQTSWAINVFFVWRIAGTGADTTGGEMLDNRTCFVGDITKKDTDRALAHEFGHCLTRFDRYDLYRDPEGHTTDTECLMDRLASGTRIMRDEADVMYTTAAVSGAT